LFGIVWWILGAWLCKSLLDPVLTRTFFPDNDEPYAQRLFADLASGLIHVLAFVGIVGVVSKEPLSTFLATSGVTAIVLGLALLPSQLARRTSQPCQSRTKADEGN
jgi:small-conductance mechanosensitive channel